MTIPILSTYTPWYCPNCGLRDRTPGVPKRSTLGLPNVRMHVCPKLRGLAAPMLIEGTAAKVEARDREDYVGTEDVQRDAAGRPVMSIVTTRDNGNDTIVLAPTARASASVVETAVLRDAVKRRRIPLTQGIHRRIGPAAPIFHSIR